MLSRFFATSIGSAAFFLFLLISLPACRAQVQMQVTDKNYLDTQGFSVFLYDSTYHPVFIDQKNTAMEMISMVHVSPRTATCG